MNTKVLCQHTRCPTFNESYRRRAADDDGDDDDDYNMFIYKYLKDRKLRRKKKSSIEKRKYNQHYHWYIQLTKLQLCHLLTID